jgi:hypothetical protein
MTFGSSFIALPSRLISPVPGSTRQPDRLNSAVEATQVFSFFEFEVRLADLLDCEIIIHFASINSTAGSPDRIVNDPAVDFCIARHCENLQASRSIDTFAIADDKIFCLVKSLMPIDLWRSLCFSYRSVNARAQRCDLLPPRCTLSCAS